MLQIALATQDQLASIRDLLLQGAAWQAEKGTINQWGTSRFTFAWLADLCGMKKLVSAHIGDELVGAIIVDTQTSRAWADDAKPALYLSKFVVKRSHAGGGTGRAIFFWCEGHARSQALSLIRFDCAASPNFVRYYEGMGYQTLGEGSMGSYRYVRMQKRLATLSP